MNILQAVEAIKKKFAETGSPTQIPKIRGEPFVARLKDEGIEVSNLGNLPFLPWAAFQEAMCIMIRKGGRAKKGKAMNHRLGESGLPLDSIEGHVAYVVYGKRPGDSVFRRITPIANILIWSGICENVPSELILKGFN